MSRKSFDATMTLVGAVVAIGLILLGGLLFWGYRYSDSQVHDQLAAQQIYFPPAGSPALADPQIGPYLNQYAGQQLVNGAQAEAYADHFIAVHLSKIANGKTYAQVSTLAQADPKNQTLATQKQTLFQGETLRGLLLNAYAFWQFGQIAFWGAMGGFVLGALMIVLVVLGFLHLRGGNVSDRMHLHRAA